VTVFGAAHSACVVAAPIGWSSQDVIAGCFPAVAQLYRAVLPEIRRFEARLDGDEAAGLDTAQLRLALGELRWRFEYTGDAQRAAAALARVRRLAAKSAAGPAADIREDCPVSADAWFLELDSLVDDWLVDDWLVDDWLAASASDGGPQPGRLLDRINQPDRLERYLNSLLVSFPARDGVDRRKELNFATASLVRLILRRRPPGYPWDSRLDSVIRRFVADWQDPHTGFFGADYQIGGQRYRTADLSLTFHMARYLEGKIGHWPRLIDTLLAMRDRRYPNGWLDRTGPSSHNNYDVAVLFQLGWPRMMPDQRRRARHELDRLLDWCLGSAISADGVVVARAASESLPESYYFAIAFLDTVGFFDPAKQFWTDCSFADAPRLRARLEHQALLLNQAQPMARMAVERLRR
jgi:hypothetical protein